MNSLAKNIVVPVRIEVPYFVKCYCNDRYTETREYLDEADLEKAFKRYKLKPLPTSRISKIKKDEPVFADCSNSSFFEGENVEHFIIICREDGLTKVLAKYPVLRLTVMKKAMLKRAAELEFMTYATEYPISLQEARYQLVDEYPCTHKPFTPYIPWLNPDSCNNLIRETKGCFKLSLNETQEISEQRRQNALRSLSQK